MIENLAELNTAITAFEQWRMNRRKSAGIPDDLILLAARAAKACGTSRTASTLGLNESNLRKRIALLDENLGLVRRSARCYENNNFMCLVLGQKNKQRVGL